MFRDTSLKTKLFVLVTAVVVASFLAVSILVTNRSMDIVTQDAFNFAQEMADRYSNEIMAELRGARVTSETLKVVLETLRWHGMTDRAMMHDLLRKALEQKEYITAFCVVFEPDMFDGRDAEYIGKGPDYSETGRFAPYWNKIGNNISVEALTEIDDEDWYIVPLETGKEYITDPYSYHVQGQDIMLVSFIFPLLADGEFIGIVASDIVLDTLQDMVSEVNTHGLGEYTEIISGSGIIVAHPNEKYHGQTIAESFFFDMVASPEKAITAETYARKYIEALQEPDITDLLQVAAYEDMLAFADNLHDYAFEPETTELEFTELPPGFLNALLETDIDLRLHAQKVSQAVRRGETYVNSGADYYTVYMPIQFGDETNPWSVAVSIPMAEVLKVSNDMRRYVLVVCGISVCVIACIIYLLSRNITGPLLRLTQSVKQIAGGDMHVDVPILYTSREMSILSTAFRSMVARIDDLISKLQSNAEQLRDKNERLNRLNAMLVATNRVAETIMNVEHQKFSDVLGHSIRILGESAGAEGVSIWQNVTYPDGKTYGRMLSSWSAAQAAPTPARETIIDLDAYLPGWNEPVKANTNCGSMLLDGSAYLHAADIAPGSGTLLFFPLILDDACWGIIGFAYGTKAQHLRGDACEALRSGGMMLASAIVKNQISVNLEEAEEKAATDALTGLMNRNGFLFRASTIFTACKEEGHALTLLFFDLDHFKHVNDRYGHPFGDEVLKAFAEVVRAEAREQDVCCRYGGEEFILLQHSKGAPEGRATAARILEAVRNIRFPKHPELSLTVSIGVIEAIPGIQDTLNGYIQMADSALYMAKDRGRDQAVFYAGEE